MKYPHIQQLINGVWKDATGSSREEVVNPASGEAIGNYALAGKADMDEALAAADQGFLRWSRMPAIERSSIMQKAAQLLRNRSEDIATLITMDEGKPLAEARMEIKSGADLIDWFAQEARRVYGREIPARVSDVTQIATREPIGAAIGFTPWNFPSSQILRKLGPALAAGCSILIKGPENTPASPMAVFRCFQDAGVPEGAIGLIFGVPSEVSEYCIPHQSIRKVTFTGSVPVGKHLAGLAGQHMKRVTMELGGHAPVIIMDDADLQSAVDALVGFKFRNAGQVCISPTRFLVHADVHDAFVSKFTEKTQALRVGDGFDEQTTMGPLIDEKRRTAIADVVRQSVAQGATLVTGGKVIEEAGYFYEPTVLTDVTAGMSIMNSEPFGPVALFQSFHTIEEALQEANRLPYGLASYAWTRSQRHALHLARGIQAGMLTINHLGLALAETPYGGVQDSGYGSEGGPEAVEAYLQTKFVSCLHQ